MITVSYQPVKAEFYRIQQANLRYNHRWLSIFPWVVIGALTLFFVIYLYVLDALDQTGLIVTFCIAIFLIALRLFGSPLVKRYSLGKIFAKQFEGVSMLNLSCTEDGIEAEAPGHSKSFIYWSAFRGWMEDDVVLVLLSGSVVRYFPKRVLTTVQLDELRTLLIEKLGPSR